MLILRPQILNSQNMFIFQKGVIATIEMRVALCQSSSGFKNSAP